MPTQFRHGFKTEAERLSQLLRSELGLGLVDRLDCKELAAHLAVPIVSLPELRKDGASTANIARLMSNDSRFSALTICVGTRRLIVYNPNHPPGRRANSLAHELAHILLDHPPTPALGVGGCRQWDPEVEAEADWLAGALLVPREGALIWLRRGGSEPGGAHHFGVSTALFRWRVNQTGVRRQLASSRLRMTH